ncbi:MAG: hypothetical protein ACPG7F_03170 [Aggregatilineales bacterium]
MVKTEPGIPNIFNITAPERYRCQLYFYHNRLSRLYLSVYKDQQQHAAFYLLFTDVAYLDCPINWQGADFSIADRDDCIELMLASGLIGQAILKFPGAYASITDHARLYQVMYVDKLIQIIAGSATMLRQLPDDI